MQGPISLRLEPEAGAKQKTKKSKANTGVQEPQARASWGMQEPIGRG